jgi:histidine ammonia-lyase
VAEAHDLVRGIVPPLERDRVLSPDIEAVAAAVSAGRFALPHYA